MDVVHPPPGEFWARVYWLINVLGNKAKDGPIGAEQRAALVEDVGESGADEVLGRLEEQAAADMTSSHEPTRAAGERMWAHVFLARGALSDASRKARGPARTARAGLGRRSSQGGRRTRSASSASSGDDGGGSEPPPEGPPPAEAHGRGDEQDRADYLIPPAPTPEIVEQADPDVAVAMYCALWRGAVDLEDLVAHLAGQVLIIADTLRRAIEREAARERRGQP